MHKVTFIWIINNSNNNSNSSNSNNNNNNNTNNNNNNNNSSSNNNNSYKYNVTEIYMSLSGHAKNKKGHPNNTSGCNAVEMNLVSYLKQSLSILNSSKRIALCVASESNSAYK